MLSLTIVVVNFETPKLVDNLVNSILSTVNNLAYEIIVVDNSNDESLRFQCNNEKVRVFYLSENKGFAHANNFGANKARGKCLLFLNSDSIVYDGSVEMAFDYFKTQNKIGVLGIRQLLSNGKLDAGCKRGFPTPLSSLYYFLGLSKRFKKSKIFGSYQQTFVDEQAVVQVDCVSGAYMLIKKSVFDLIGGFDEQFFLYGEDVDLCYRLRECGFKNVYFGKTHFTHLKNGSGAGSFNALKYFYNSMKIFYNKHYRKKYGFLVNFLVKFAINLKFVFSASVLFVNNMFFKRKRIKRG